MAEAVMAIGGVVGAYGQFTQAKASEKAEKLRKRQMNLEAMRKKREIIREGVMARAQALSAATAQGGAESSGLAGGYGQITGQVNRNLLATTQDQKLGNKMFKANQQYAQGGMISSVGSGVASVGQQLPGAQDALKMI
jgi:hypothetical protein